MYSQPSLYEGFVPADSTKSNVIKFASQLIESSDVKCTDWGGGQLYSLYCLLLLFSQ